MEWGGSLTLEGSWPPSVPPGNLPVSLHTWWLSDHGPSHLLFDGLSLQVRFWEKLYPVGEKKIVMRENSDIQLFALQTWNKGENKHLTFWLTLFFIRKSKCSICYLLRCHTTNSLYLWTSLCISLVYIYYYKCERRQRLLENHFSLFKMVFSLKKKHIQKSSWESILLWV